MGKRLFIIIAITATILVSCSKKPLRWDVDIAAPIVKTELTLANLLPDSLLAADEDHAVSIVLDKELFSASVESIATFPDSLFEFALDIPQHSSLAPGILFFYKDELQKLDIAPVSLNYVKIYSGSLTFNVINPFDKPIEINYRIPAATKNGVSFNEIITIPPGNSSGTAYTKNVSMAGYFIDLRGTDQNSSNRFMTRMSARISASSADSARSIHEKLFINIKFQNVALDYLKGYFGELSSSYGGDTIKTNIFESITAGELQTEKCEAQIEISNGFGADARLLLQKIKALNSRTGKEVSLQSNLIGRPVNITRAAETAVGQGAIPYTAKLDLSASNLNELLTIFPDKFEYAASLTLNPLGNISCGNDFAYRANPFSAKLHFKLPLKFSAKGLTLQKTIKYNLSGGPENINTATLYLIANNSFPLSMAINLEVLDSYGKTILTIPQSGQTLQAGILAADGTTTPRQTIIKFELDKDNTDILKNSSNLKITATFDTPENQKVTIFEAQKLDLKLTADFNYEVSIQK